MKIFYSKQCNVKQLIKFLVLSSGIISGILLHKINTKCLIEIKDSIACPCATFNCITVINNSIFHIDIEDSNGVGNKGKHTEYFDCKKSSQLAY